MKFGPTPAASAEGAILAHSLRLPDGTLKKGRLLTAADIRRLTTAGIDTVVAARLDAEDTPEDAAAARVAAALQPDLASAGLDGAAPFTGRANLYAATPGLFRASRALIDAVNAVDPAITVATLPDAAWVTTRAMALTVKIIPYAAPEPALQAVEALLADAAPRDRPRVAPPVRTTASLALTRTPGMREKLLAKGAAAVRERLAALGVTLIEERVVAHETDALAEALTTAAGDLVLALAASATSDPADVTPMAIRAAGGLVDRVGMPVDPGNLLVLGRLGERPVVGLPGCARSPARNGADDVLERLVAGEPVTDAVIAGMGVGGLLKEIPSRPSPRIGARAATPSRPVARGLLLAAGGSTRMGPGRHKLLEPIDGRPLIRRSAERLLASRLDGVIVVLGAEAEATAAALDDLPVTTVTAADWAAGQAMSLRAGLSTLDAQTDAVAIALADMPEVDAPLVDRVLAAFDPGEGREIIRPTAPDGRPGHPVLFGRRFFEALASLEGDDGARRVIDAHRDYLVEIPLADAVSLTDLDTPEAWAAYHNRHS